MGYHLTQADYDRMKRLCEIHSHTTVCEIMGVSMNAIWRAKKRGWVRDGNVKRRRKRPSDFALMADTMTIKQLASHYGTWVPAVKRWLSEIGSRNYKHKPYKLPIPCPPDFEEVWRKLGNSGAAKHYGVCRCTARRWQRELGLTQRRRKAANENGIGWVERYVEQHRRAA